MRLNQELLLPLSPSRILYSHCGKHSTENFFVPSLNKFIHTYISHSHIRFGYNMNVVLELCGGRKLWSIIPTGVTFPAHDALGRVVWSKCIAENSVLLPRRSCRFTPSLSRGAGRKRTRFKMWET